MLFVLVLRSIGEPRLGLKRPAQSYNPRPLLQSGLEERLHAETVGAL